MLGTVRTALCISLHCGQCALHCVLCTVQLLVQCAALYYTYLEVASKDAEKELTTHHAVQTYASVVVFFVAFFVVVLAVVFFVVMVWTRVTAIPVWAASSLDADRGRQYCTC